MPIGEWVVREACREIGALERELKESLILAVNLSPLQFQQKYLAQMIEQTLLEYGRSPSCMEFEVTESLLMSDSATTLQTLKLLRGQGIRIAIDDFGIGFSSFSYIMRFAVDRLKIDRSFVKSLIGNQVHDRSAMAVIRAIITMTHGLGIEVVAEGVETEEQFRLLQREGCEIAQGYLLSRPVPADQIPEMLRTLKYLPILATTANDAADAGKLVVA